MDLEEKNSVLDFISFCKQSYTEMEFFIRVFLFTQESFWQKWI